MAEMPVSAVARELRVHDTRLWYILSSLRQQRDGLVDMSRVKRIAVDETSSRCGHRYITLFIDVDIKTINAGDPFPQLQFRQWILDSKQKSVLDGLTSD